MKARNNQLILMSVYDSSTCSGKASAARRHETGAPPTSPRMISVEPKAKDDTDLAAPRRYGRLARKTQTSRLMIMKDGWSLDRMDAKATVWALWGDENRALGPLTNLMQRVLFWKQPPLPSRHNLEYRRLLKWWDLTYTYISEHVKPHCTCKPGLRLTVKPSQSPDSVLLLPLCSGKAAKAHRRQ